MDDLASASENLEEVKSTRTSNLIERKVKYANNQSFCDDTNFACLVLSDVAQYAGFNLRVIVRQLLTHHQNVMDDLASASENLEEVKSTRTSNLIERKIFIGTVYVTIARDGYLGAQNFRSIAGVKVYSSEGCWNCLVRTCHNPGFPKDPSNDPMTEESKPEENSTPLLPAHLALA
ncbi:hypothetical protein WH47_10255 [Habropoda laboriosa]|uniref:Uncharacterized protein n=1 Tax=Habropoda laboriosa TaxID=597456 RepID=A0A0L7R4L8_9HYME|nr:hypothetical protein WH47_10255 [Habropoda laboriosa]